MQKSISEIEKYRSPMNESDFQLLDRYYTDFEENLRQLKLKVMFSNGTVRV